MNNDLEQHVKNIVEVESTEVPSEGWYWAGVAVGVTAVALAD
ncbi:hypothetical protein [Apilactobacillus kunkeei]